MTPGPGLETVVLADEIVVGVSKDTPAVVPDDYDVLLTTRPAPPRPWVRGSIDELAAGVARAPVAAATLVQILRAGQSADVRAAVVLESLAYSTLQHGEVFQRWLSRRQAPRARPAQGDPVHLERHDDRLEIVLRRPEVHNAMDAGTRDALCEAFALVEADPTIAEVHLRGEGPSFCSGGDLNEFGTAADAGVAHLIRVARSVGLRVHRSAARVHAHLHGSCIGAGIEVSAFASQVSAAPDTTIQLPELAMGLVPGAGGTVSVPRRIGRHRTAYLVLTGTPIGADLALAWGAVDRIEPAGSGQLSIHSPVM